MALVAPNTMFIMYQHGEIFSYQRCNSLTVELQCGNSEDVIVNGYQIEFKGIYRILKGSISRNKETIVLVFSKVFLCRSVFRPFFECRNEWLMSSKCNFYPFRLLVWWDSQEVYQRLHSSLISVPSPATRWLEMLNNFARSTEINK